MQRIVLYRATGFIVFVLSASAAWLAILKCWKRPVAVIALYPALNVIALIVLSLAAMLEC